MYVAGIDAHATYLVVVIVSNTGELVEGPTRMANAESERLVEVLARYEPIEAVVETSPAWPWLYELLSEHGAFSTRPGYRSWPPKVCFG